MSRLAGATLSLSYGKAGRYNRIDLHWTRPEPPRVSANGVCPVGSAAAPIEPAALKLLAPILAAIERANAEDAQEVEA